jgi:hypothetical protein
VLSGRVVMMYGVKTGKLLDEVECHESADGKAVLISPDGRTLATRSGSINGQDRPVQPLLKLWTIPDSW